MKDSVLINVAFVKLELPGSGPRLVIIEHCHFEHYLEVRNSLIHIMSIEYLEQFASRFIQVSMNIGITILPLEPLISSHLHVTVLAVSASPGSEVTRCRCGDEVVALAR